MNWGVFYAPKFHIPCSDNLNVFFKQLYHFNNLNYGWKYSVWKNMIEIWMNEEHESKKNQNKETFIKIQLKFLWRGEMSNVLFDVHKLKINQIIRYNLKLTFQILRKMQIALNDPINILKHKIERFLSTPEVKYY